MGEEGVLEEEEPTRRETPPPPPAVMEPAKPFSLQALAAALALLMAVLIFHPGLLNLLVRSEDTSVTLQHVQNFYYWNRYHQGAPQELTVASQISLGNTYFYPRHTYIIIHGFISSGMDGWIITLKDALLGREDCNVISVDWAAGSLTPEYYIINGRVPVVGEDVSKLILFLQHTTGLTPNLVHIIGHSLGAHVAGFTGKKLNGTIARITGLDPAGHMYHQVEATERLDKTDALFVDVIHSHGCTTVLSQWRDCYGIDENIGDADFWPNGGEHQPACKDGGDGAVAVKDGSSCDHGMAYVFYIESLAYTASTTRFLARPCILWELYNNGSCPCSHPAQYMGYNVNPNAPGVFFLNTSITAPYALLDPHCSPGVFSALQIIGLVLVTVFLVLMLLLVVLTLLPLHSGMPVVTRVKVALGMDISSWHGTKESQSTQCLAGEDNKVLI